jgi:hypothetical protein
MKQKNVTSGWMAAMNKKQLSPFDYFLLVVALCILVALFASFFFMFFDLVTSEIGREMLLLFSPLFLLVGAVFFLFYVAKRFDLLDGDK